LSTYRGLLLLVASKGPACPEDEMALGGPLARFLFGKENRAQGSGLGAKAIRDFLLTIDDGSTWGHAAEPCTFFHPRSVWVGWAPKAFPRFSQRWHSFPKQYRAGALRGPHGPRKSGSGPSAKHLCLRQRPSVVEEIDVALIAVEGPTVSILIGILVGFKKRIAEQAGCANHSARVHGKS